MLDDLDRELRADRDFDLDTDLDVERETDLLEGEGEQGLADFFGLLARGLLSLFLDLSVSESLSDVETFFFFIFCGEPCPSFFSFLMASFLGVAPSSTE